MTDQETIDALHRITWPEAVVAIVFIVAITWVLVTLIRSAGGDS